MLKDGMHRSFLVEIRDESDNKNSMSYVTADFFVYANLIRVQEAHLA